MQAMMEPIFEIPYLIGVVLLGVLIMVRAKGDKQHTVFGLMAVILGCGDAFHLVPRMWALFTAGTATLPEHAAALGFGKLVTSITMTVFYVLLYYVWQQRYKKRNAALTACVYILAASRVALCLLPQNDWLSPDAPLIFGIYRNIPFAILGAVIIALFFAEARKSRDKAFANMWIAITLSFAFYIPVVLFADAVPLIGMLMIPKTCAYVWIVLMGFNSVKSLTSDSPARSSAAVAPRA